LWHSIVHIFSYRERVFTFLGFRGCTKRAFTAGEGGEGETAGREGEAQEQKDKRQERKQGEKRQGEKR
jgi:hypothetical protein